MRAFRKTSHQHRQGSLAAGCPASQAGHRKGSNPGRYILFTPERGLISEHQSLGGARLAVFAEMMSGSAPEPPEIYEQIGSDWARVMTRSEATVFVSL
jgi:hypothetical protein